MSTLISLISDYSSEIIPILGGGEALEKYTRIDLSVDNLELAGVDITNPDACQNYIDLVLDRNDAMVAYGGYLEKRNLYADKADFSGEGQPTRNIHLGVDFWAPAGTQVLVPVAGKVHSFKNNATRGDYGPTVILSHTLNDVVFYTLYGHLSLESLEALFVGKKFQQGDVLATLGTPEVNVNYAPHLHFQLIRNLNGFEGDYPGVCNEKDKEYFTQNCPDPNLLLKI